MADIHALRNERANVGQQMTDLLRDAQGTLSAEDSEKFDRLNARYDELDETLTRLDKVEQINSVDRSQLRVVQQETDDGQLDFSARPEYMAAFTSFVKNGVGEMDPAQRNILRGGATDSETTKGIKAALGTGSTAGGYTIPAEFRNRIIEAQVTVNPVRGVVDTISTDSGANLPWPTVDDTDNVGAILAENTQVSQQDVEFGTASLDAYMYTSKLVLVSYQLLQDTGFDLEGWLRGALSRRIGRIQNTHFTTGTGSSQPDGLVTGLDSGNTVTGATGTTTSLGSNAGVAYGNLIDVMDKIDDSYLPNAKWMANKTARSLVRKLVDANNLPVWQPSLTAGQPEMLLGYPIVKNSAMAAPGAGNVTFLFGDYQAAYVIRDVRDLFLIRFGERYADYLQVGFAMFQRTDGTVQNSAAYSGYKHAAS